MKTNEELKKEIKKDIKRLKEELKEMEYWCDWEKCEEIRANIETQEDELKRL